MTTTPPTAAISEQLITALQAISSRELLYPRPRTIPGLSARVSLMPPSPGDLSCDPQHQPVLCSNLRHTIFHPCHHPLREPTVPQLMPSLLKISCLKYQPPSTLPAPLRLHPENPQSPLSRCPKPPNSDANAHQNHQQKPPPPSILAAAHRNLYQSNLIYSHLSPRHPTSRKGLAATVPLLSVRPPHPCCITKSAPVTTLSMWTWTMAYVGTCANLLRLRHSPTS